MNPMRKIEFKIRVATGMMVVLIDGKVIPDLNFDRRVVQDAVKNHRVSPVMADHLLDNIKRKLTDSTFNLQPNEVYFIIKRFEEEFK